MADILAEAEPGELLDLASGKAGTPSPWAAAGESLWNADEAAGPGGPKSLQVLRTLPSAIDASW